MYLSIMDRDLHHSLGHVVLRPRRSPKNNKWEITYYNGSRYNAYTFDKFDTQELCQARIKEMVEENHRKFVSDYYEETIADQDYGTCKVCGCTDDNACTHPDHGSCWWVHDNHVLCSHCFVEEIAGDPQTTHPKIKKTISGNKTTHNGK